MEISLRLKLLFVLIVVGIIFLTGTAGYVYIEGWSVLDSLYMTAITLTSVGYQEVHPLSETGRIFTIFLVICGYGMLAVMVGLVSTFVIETEFTEIRKLRKMEKKLQKLENHYIICGGGRIGERAAEEFIKTKTPFVIIEKREERVSFLIEKYEDIICIKGDATDEDILKKAGIEKAKGILATFPSDADNLFVVISAKAINPSLRIISRAAEEETQKKLIAAGADAVILPNLTGALRMVSLAIRPNVVSFLDVMTGAGEVTLNLEEVKIPPSSQLAGKTLGEAQIPRKTGLIVIAVKKRDTQTFKFNPLSTEKLDSEDVLIVLGNSDQIKKLKEYVKRGAI
ncbi:MAG TPA: potassium channel protein [Candidatus Aerophobetes bacterium]|uniref:Potassium channel protein n=1 Tax=Aerophobetes bacterium TaxID=2030807 RepID=A0A7V5HY48_UNCAE|nr:potassium channel protein [Candidatus Aerophobetes bacterium]